MSFLHDKKKRTKEVCSKHIDQLLKFTSSVEKSTADASRLLMNFPSTFHVDSLRKESWGYDETYAKQTHSIDDMARNFLSLPSTLIVHLLKTSQGWKRSFHTLRPFYCQAAATDWQTHRNHWPEERRKEEKYDERRGKIRVGNFMVMFSFPTCLFMCCSLCWPISLTHNTVLFECRPWRHHPWSAYGHHAILRI